MNDSLFGLEHSEVAARWMARGTTAAQVAAKLLALRYGVTDDEGYPLARATVMNLVVYTEGIELIDKAAQALDDITLAHPCRSIMLAPVLGDKFSLDAEVLVQRHPLAKHGLILERVYLRPRGASPEDLDTLVIPVLIPHLRSSLWWLGPPSPSHLGLQSLMRIFDRVLFDSSTGTGSHLVAWASSLSETPTLSDIGWLRLAGFRRVVARLFEEEKLPGITEGITGVEISGARAAGEQVLPAELLFAGWITSCLGLSKPVPIEGGVALDNDSGSGRVTISFVAGGRGNPREKRNQMFPALRGFRFTANAGKRRFEAVMKSLTGESSLLVSGGSSAGLRAFALKPMSDAEILSQELGQAEETDGYLSALSAAGRIASVLSSG